MIRLFLCLALAILARAAEPASGSADPAGKVATLLQPTTSPLVTFRVLFQTGAASDPPGKEGLAALTAAMLAEGGSQRLAYEEILKRLYPLASRVQGQVDKEMTVISGATHLDNLQRYYRIFRDMILAPGFRQEDFNRVKSDALNYLRVTLREGNDEELAKERLYSLIYAGHPYEHHNLGEIAALEKLTVEDVKQFYASNYTRAGLVFGLAGGYPESLLAQIQNDFGILPEGQPGRIEIGDPAPRSGLRIDIVKRDTRSTAISIGFPIEVTRAHPDYVALKLVESFFGQHRSSNSHLYQRLREARGLNYGDYAYIEYFPAGMFRFQPEPNLARQEQIFQIWIRPTQPEHAVFALRAALFELDKLVREGLSQEQFESTREFLSKFVDVLLQTQSASLGYALDSRYYRTPPYRQQMKEGLASLTLDQANQALRKHLKTPSMTVVMVTKDAEGLKEALLSGKPSPISYNSPKPDDLLAEDKIIEKYPIPAVEDQVTITTFNAP